MILPWDASSNAIGEDGSPYLTSTASPAPMLTFITMCHHCLLTILTSLEVWGRQGLHQSNYCSNPIPVKCLAHNRYPRKSCSKNKWMKKHEKPFVKVISPQSMQSTVLSFCMKNPGDLDSPLKALPSQEPLPLLPHMLGGHYSILQHHISTILASFLQLMGSMCLAVELIPSCDLGLGRNTRGGQNCF